MGTRGLSLGVKRQGREADHSSPSGVEVTLRVAIRPLPQYAFMAWCLDKKHMDNLTFLPFMMMVIFTGPVDENHLLRCQCVTYISNS
jgi:hypothetical protein